MRPTPSIPAELIAVALPTGESTSASDTQSVEAVIERLHDDVILPAPATPGSAGYDLRAYLKGRTIRHSAGMSLTERAAVE